MKKTTKLTSEQEQSLQDTITRWLAIGRSTEPINKERAAASIAALYQAIGKPRPTVLFFSSPMMCILAWEALRTLSKKSKSQLYSQLGSQLYGQLYNQLGSQLYKQLSGQLYNQLYSQLYNQLYSQLYNQLRDQLYNQLSDQLYNQLDSQLDSQLYNQLSNRFAGAWWCWWGVFYDFCRTVGVKYTQQQNSILSLWTAQCEQCHWWFPYEGIVLASERPTVCAVDEQGRLHSEDGMALVYSDGWGFPRYHGVSSDDLLKRLTA